MKIETKLDVPAIRARIKELEKLIRDGKLEAKQAQRDWGKTRKGWPPCSSPKEAVYSERDEATTLYCLLAHSRGKLHMSKRREFDDKTQTWSCVPFTMEEQWGRVELWVEDFALENDVDVASA